jgi:hypothetical protein
MVVRGLLEQFKIIARKDRFPTTFKPGRKMRDIKHEINTNLEISEKL